ncbi:acyl-CoA dehydratase activase-related protein [uncultured Clostridium sp.]|uniref:acyl-CoA dehydratase activase-related protein n=1 Tax=uncultured Clostridium sp. TaxID=59620 RepID=UPI0028E21E7F|nr:acyl-CoA dehydratase activase-related protein [uncultured Clostridium sp.]
MIKKVGIPRALLYYEYYPLWVCFFKELGVEVIISNPTNKEILDEGTRNAVDEACIPVKLFHGHVLSLKNKVDYIFIPRLKSIENGEFICPKFCGLPEMIKYSLKDLPPIIDTEIDFLKSKRSLKSIILEIGKYFCSDEKQIMKAYHKALINYENHKKLLKIRENLKHKKKNVLILGHPYHLYDTYLNMGIIEKIKDAGINILTPEMIDESDINEQANTFEDELYWTFARKLVGSTLHALNTKEVDGIIYISTFACGIDSVVVDIVQKVTRDQSDIPFMLLTLDEHSGEAGVDTRIEAFVDMIKWRDDYENNLSAHG